MNWVEINDFSNYMVSDCGKVLSLNYNHSGKRKILANLSSSGGYWGIGLNSNGKTKRFLVHRLVAMHYCENPDNKPYVNHIDGDKQNNHQNNLEWCTHRENMLHASKNGLMSRGENQHHSKLKEVDVLEIVELRKGGLTQEVISNRFNVKRKAISDICIGKSWSYLTGIIHQSRISY
jgi:hypothetical protein